MSRTKKILLVLIVLVIGFVVIQMTSPLSESVKDWLANNQKIPASEVPRTDSGGVDFPTLTNQRLGKTATVENNLIVDLYQIYPDNPGLATATPEFLELLGNPERSGPRLSSFIGDSQFPSLDATGQPTDWTEDYTHCTQTPWNSSEFPELKAWLDRNQQPIDKMVRASKKPIYYHPVVVDAEQSPIIGALMVLPQEMRNVARTLSIRAMNHLAEGRCKECLSDMAAMRRLGFKIKQGNSLIESLVGTAIGGMVFELESTVLSSGQLTAAMCDAYQQTIAETTTTGTPRKLHRQW